MKLSTSAMSRSELVWVARYHDFQSQMCYRHKILMDRKVQEFGLTGKRAGRFIRLNGLAVKQATAWLKEPAIRPYLEAVR